MIPIANGNNSNEREIDEKLKDYNYYCFDDDSLLQTSHFERSSQNNNYVNDYLEKFPTPTESSSTISINGPMDSSWPMKCHDNRHTGRSLYSTADNLGVEKWRFFEDSWIEVGPVIDTNGIIYIADSWGDINAIYSNGTMKWKFTTEGQIMGSTPAIAEDGTIYVGTWYDYLYAINLNGTEKWRFDAQDTVASSPAIAEDGTIYFGTMGSGYNIYAVNPNGTEKWHYPTGYYITSDPAIGDDGTIYIGSGDNYLYAMHPNGTLRWRFPTGHYVKGPVSIADDGTVYFGSYDDYLYALYPNNGTMKWRYPIGTGTETNPSIGCDGTIYVGDDRLYAIYPNGTLRWAFDLGPNGCIHQSSPAISADGTIYVGTNIGETSGGEIIAVNPNGTEKWRKMIANKWVESSPSIAEDGTVYIGSSYDMETGYLYAFGIGELEADADGPYYGLVDEPVQFTGSATGGYTPYQWLWNFRDGDTSDEQNPIHTYTDAGNYTVTLTVIDNTSNTSSNSTWAWIQTSNTPPNKPTISGETYGDVGTSYDYTFTAVDPDESIIWYYVDWGDGSSSGWVGPFDSGQQMILSHSWSNKGTYNISAKAKDPYDAEGPWGYLEVEMPVNYQSSQSSQHFKSLMLFQILEKIMNYPLSGR